MSDPATCVTVGELRTQSPAPVQPDDALRSAVGALIGAGLVALPVTDDSGRLVGLLDEEDLLVLAGDPHLVEQQAEVARFWPLAGERSAAKHLRLIQAQRVSEVMRHHPPSVHVSARFDLAAEVVADHHAGVLPVTDEKGHLVGVLARQALLQAWWAGRLC
ncbi:MAG: CBS domain-containing protein [Actinomycetota bacterium]|nr:CBS domain-containing protein [Actinomycetota bacterium]MDA8381315.1 CBS domain-containing protein [Actinomycetota bacterium]